MTAVAPDQVRAYYGSRLKISLRPNGEGWVTVRSPFRSDHNASLGVNLHHGGWRDHGTDESGDIFGFEMRLSGCDFQTAKARILGEAAGELPTIINATPATVEALAQAKKLPIEFLRSFGLENRPQGVFIPYKSADNSPAQRHRIRAFLEHREKWCYWKQGAGEIEPYGLWRLAEARKAEFLILVEGESDCWTLWYHGLPALGISGADMTDTLKGEHLAGIGRVFLIQETDPAGVHYVQKMLARLKETGWAGETRILSLAPSKDPSELHCADLAKFKATFQAALDGAQDAAKWKSPAMSVPGVLASEVKPEQVRWLWKGYLTLGKITIFEGDPDEGKSTVALDLVARNTRGSEMPDGSAGMPASGAVVVSLEDGIADTIVPRLMAANAELSKVRVIQTIKGPDGIDRTPTLPVDLLAIEAAIKAVDAKTVVIDPLVATLAGETNSFRDQDIRRVLAPVAALAERIGVAVIVIRHLNKGNNPNPKYRGGGSIGILGAARAGFLFGANPDDEQSKVMANVKMNLAEKPSAMAYRLQGEQVTFEGAIIETVRVTWEGVSQHTVKSILAEPETEEESNALVGAKNFLTEFLSDGPKDSKEVKGEARAAGFAERTLFRAKDLLAVKAKHSGFGKDGKWKWELPKAATPNSKAANSGNLAALEEVPETKPVNSTSSLKVAKVENMAALRRENGILCGDSAPGLHFGESKPEGGLRDDADSMDI